MGDDRLSRGNAIIWAQRMAEDLDAVYLDTETTGIGEDAEIVDIAIVGNDGAVFFDSLVKPRRAIPREASMVHGIYAGDVEGAPSWEEISPVVHSLLAWRTVVIFNADYDFRILTAANDDIDVPMPQASWECAMLAYAGFVGEMIEFQYRRGFRWHSLAQAAKAFGIQPGKHRALADAEACRKVVHAMGGSR